MNFSALKADVYRRCGFASSPDTATATRIGAFINEVQQDLISEPGMEFLLNDTITLATVANQETYGLPQEVSKIKFIREQTNNIRLTPMSMGEYRAIYPNPTLTTGTPTRYVDLGYDSVDVEPSDLSNVYVLSSSASDTGSAYLEGYTSGGIFRSETIVMTGSTAVASTYTYLSLTKFYISTAAVGTVTLREDSGSGTVLSTIPIGATYARYRRIAFAPPPAAAITYYIDCERLVTDLVNDTDEPLVPQRFHRLLAIGARAKEYEKQNQVGRSQLAKQEYDKELKKLKFWVYESTVGTPNMRGTGYTRTALSDGGTLAVASSSAASPLAVTSGGTGFASYAIGDLLYADTATTLAKLPDVATGKVLRSGGVGVAPAYGQVTLTTDVTGTLPVANGGTGIATLTANRVPFGNGTSAFQSNANFTFDGTTFTTTGQIAFPATQAPSSGVNTLDDYEEGTWTPVLGGSGGTSGQTYTTQTGNYVKIGKQVFAHFEVLLSAKGTITTNVQIQGLPFTSATGTGIGAGAVGYWTTTATNWIALSLVVTSASTVATVFGISATGTAGPINLVTADIANTTRIIGTLSYMASA